jgi:hypothetical protein
MKANYIDSQWVLPSIRNSEHPDLFRCSLRSAPASPPPRRDVRWLDRCQGAAAVRGASAIYNNAPRLGSVCLGFVNAARGCQMSYF